MGATRRGLTNPLRPGRAALVRAYGVSDERPRVLRGEGVVAPRPRPRPHLQGLGRQVLAELVDWGAAQGATTLWLHVETDNRMAIALYESLGFRTHHGCRYLTA